MDKIIIKDLHIFAYHGVNPEEKENGQNFYLDLVCEADLSVPCQTDRVEDTVSYAKIVKTAIAAFTAAKYDLIERAADAVAAAVLSGYPMLAAVTVTVKKPEAPVKADFETVAVEIRRARV